MTTKGVACNEAIKFWLDEWMMDDPIQTPRKHYNLIHKDGEGPFSKEECAAGVMTKSAKAKSGKVKSNVADL